MTDVTYNNCCPQLWREIHLRAINIPASSASNQQIVSAETAFINAWALKIPVKGCRCSAFWTVWYRSNPINFADYFAWTVSAHNAVNAKLGRPLWSVDKARRFWSTQK